MMLSVLFLAFLLAFGESIKVALHAQAEPGEKVVGSVLTTDGMAAALRGRGDIELVSIFYPFSYIGFIDESWDIIIIEGWFPGLNEFLFLARANMPDDGVVLFYCLDQMFPGLSSIQTFDVDGYFTNSHDLVEKLGSSAPTKYVMLAANPEVMAPNASVAREFGAVYVGAGGPMLREKPRLTQILEAAIPHGLRLHGSGWQDGGPPLSDAWRGFLPREELSAAYASAHVVLAATIETQTRAGMVNNRIFEALACGALVVTDHSDLLETLFGDVLLLAREPSDVARFIMRARDEPEWADAYRIRARAHILGNHTWANRIMTMLAFANELREAKRTHNTRLLASAVRRQAFQGSEPLRGTMPRVLWLESDLLRGHTDYEFSARTYRTYLAPRYNVTAIETDAGTLIDGDEFDLIFAALSGVPEDPAVQILQELPSPSARNRRRALGSERLQKVVCLAFPDDTSAETQSRMQAQTCASSDAGACPALSDVGKVLGNVCDVVVGRSSHDVDTFSRLVAEAGSYRKGSSLRFSVVFGVEAVTHRLLSRVSAETHPRRPLVMICVWELRQWCTGSVAQGAAADGDAVGHMSLLLIGTPSRGQGHGRNPWSALPDAVTAVVDASLTVVLGGVTELSVIERSATMIASADAIFFAHPGVDDAQGGGRWRAWPLVLAAHTHARLLVPAAHPPLLAAADAAAAATPDDLRRQVARSMQRVHGLASARSRVSLVEPAPGTRVQVRDFIVRVITDEYTTGVDGRLCLMHRGDIVVCSITPSFVFRLRLRAHSEERGGRGCSEEGKGVRVDGSGDGRDDEMYRVPLSIRLKGGMFADEVHETSWHYDVPPSVMMHGGLLPNETYFGSIDDIGVVLDADVFVC